MIFNIDMNEIDIFPVAGGRIKIVITDDLDTSRQVAFYANRWQTDQLVDTLVRCIGAAEENEARKAAGDE